MPGPSRCSVSRIQTDPVEVVEYDIRLSYFYCYDIDLYSV